MFLICQFTHTFSKRRNLLKWRLKVKADLEQGTEGAVKKSVDHLKDKGDAAKPEVKEESEDDADALEDEIKDALYEERRLDKK
jgi:hypothetical protein